jgi:pimeloyl-ACP methyl ester carboxylesterase
VDARLADAWTAYEPLRDWLATSPVFPTGDVNEGDTIVAADLLGGTLFTVRDPTTLMVKLADTVESGAAPAVGSLTVCTGASPAPCSDPTAEDFTEVQGTVTLPIYQQGTIPYVATGGNIAVDGSGDPVQQGTQDVRFALTLPEGPGTWPVIIYAHGTDGDFRSHIDEGLAGPLALAGFAVLGFDQLGHGTRANGSTLPPAQIFFNLTNPKAARGNVLQSATDILAVQHAIAAIAGDLGPVVTGADLDDASVAFLGHSQGAISGALATAMAENLPTVVFSGAGGGLIDTLSQKRSPYDLTVLLPIVFADPGLVDLSANPTKLVGRRHPVLSSVIQAYLEEADPINYAPYITVPLAARGEAKNVLHLVGVGDTYTPNDTSVAFARRMVVQYIDPNHRLIQASDPSLNNSPPIRNNLGGHTRVTSIHEPTGSNDGHFVMFDDAVAQNRMVSFFETWQSDASNIPSVVP